jgi:hypothetical protein
MTEYPVVVPPKFEPMMRSNLIERLEEIAKRSKEVLKPGAETHPITFASERLILPVWTVPITLPRYRLENGRTLSAQLEWVATHKDAGTDFFRRDPESIEAQYIQHTLLKKMMTDAGLSELFNDDSVKQDDPLILDHRGYVVNGNRRLCLWRELKIGKPAKYEHFEHLRVAVLPERSPQAITKLEVNLQVKRDVRAGYKWHALAHMYRQNKEELDIDDAAIAELWEVDASDVTEHLKMLESAERFLQSRGKDEQWSEVDGDLFAFKKLVATLPKIKHAGEKHFFQIAAFNIIDQKDKSERLYERVPDILKYMPAIKKELVKSYPVTATGGENELLGGTAPDISIPLAKAIDTPSARAPSAKIIEATINDQKAIEAAKKSEDAFLKLIGNANSNLTAAELELKNDRKCNTAGAASQLDSNIEIATRLKTTIS